MAVSASPLMASMTLRPPPSSPYPTSRSGLRRTLSVTPTLTVSLPRPKSKVFPSSSSPPIPTENPPNPTHSGPFAGTTRTKISLFKLPASEIPPLSLKFRPNSPLPVALSWLPPKLLLFAAINRDLPLLPPGPPIFSPRNPNPLFRRKPTALTFPLRPPKKCKLVAYYSPPPPIPTRNHNHSQLTASIAAWPLFFAAMSPQIFGCVLLIRVLLGCFPNIQWDNLPMSAVRDLCDPYLGLFRGIIPPLFNSLDVSPILAFLLLGMLVELARPPRPY